MTGTAISAVPPTSFGAAGFRERTDLQRLLKDHIDIVAPDTLVIAEEFGAWDVSYRRIDLLGVDRDANLVVVELKRDDTGAHMELQALRYAAMVARMTFDQAVSTYQAHLTRSGSAEDARTALLRFLEWDAPDEASFAQDVRIVLVAADFSRELTTSVMWLNERDLDIRCVQLQPYRLGDQLLLQVDQVIPLREAGDYQVQVREKARREREATSGGADWTRYDLTIGGVVSQRLYKRWLVYYAVRHVVQRLGKTPEEVAAVIRHSRPWAWVDGTHDAESFRAGLDALAAAGGPRLEPRRFFTATNELIAVNGRTYAFTNQWGTNTLPAMDALRAAFPEAQITYSACDQG